MKIDEASYRIINDAMTILNKNYEIHWFDKDLITGFIDDEEILTIIEDLIYEVDHLNETIEDMKNDIESNYRPLTKAEQYEISDRDFYDKL